MAKIGILTYFFDHNAGTFLQALATVDAFKTRLPSDTVELVDWRFVDMRFRFEKRHLYIPHLLRELRRFRIYEREIARRLNLSSDSLVSKDYDEVLRFLQSQDYDLLISGADTILEFRDFHHQTSSVPVYWLPPDLGRNRAMCGSSARDLSLSHLNASQRHALKRCVAGLELVGVRDASTAALIRDLGLADHSRLVQIPDPTFSLEIDHDRVASVIKKWRLDFSKPCVMLGLPWKYPLARAIAGHYKKRGFRVVSLTYSPFSDVYVPDLSPFEWAGIYKYFDLVLTDRFHGTLFSIRNGTPVMSIVPPHCVTPDGESKYRSLWRLFGLEETNWIYASDPYDLNGFLRKVDVAVEAFRATVFDHRLQELKQEYLAFVDRVARLIR